MALNVGASARGLLRKTLWRLGYDVMRYNPVSHPTLRRRKLFDDLRIDLVLDVGANAGQFATRLRRDRLLTQRRTCRDG